MDVIQGKCSRLMKKGRRDWEQSQEIPKKTDSGISERWGGMGKDFKKKRLRKSMLRVKGKRTMRLRENR